MTLDITTTDSVRSVLGVSALELPDAVLGQQHYMTILHEDLRDLHPQLLADYQSTVALASLSDVQQRFVDLTQAYASYNVARQCLTSAPMFAPQLIKETKAEAQRVQDPYHNLRRDVGATLGVLAVRLLTAYPLINTSASAPAPATRVWGATVGLGSDPVTGT